MNQTVKSVLSRTIGPIRCAFVAIPRLVREPSYYPEKKRKSALRRYLELLRTRIFNGYAELFYNAYGFDCRDGNDKNQECYVNEKQFWKKVIPLNWQGQTNYAVILRDKCLFDVFMRAYGVRIAETVGWVNHGHFYMKDGAEVSAARFFELVARQDGILFVMAATSCCARGVVKVVADACGFCVSGSRDRLDAEWFKGGSISSRRRSKIAMRLAQSSRIQ